MKNNVGIFLLFLQNSKTEFFSLNFPKRKEQFREKYQLITDCTFFFFSFLRKKIIPSFFHCYKLKRIYPYVNKIYKLKKKIEIDEKKLNKLNK